MVHEGLRGSPLVDRPMALKRGMDAAVQAVNAALRRSLGRCPVKKRSPRSRPSRPRTAEIGGLIADAFDKVGKDGVISVEESSTTAMELEFTEGMQFDKGYISPYFVTDTERMEAVLEDAVLLLVQGKISSVSEMLPVLEKVVESRQAAVDHRRGCRWRSALHTGGQPDSRHASLRSP